jgi:hypothetical protein
MAELAFGRVGPAFTWRGFARDLAVGVFVVILVAVAAITLVMLRRD